MVSSAAYAGWVWQPCTSTSAKAGLSDRETRNALDVGGLGGRRPWGISSESLLGRRGPGPAASRGRETRHWAPPYAQTARMAVRRRAIRCIRGRPRRVSTSMRCGRGAVCVLRGARACPERAGRSAVAILTYLLTAYHGSDNRLIIIRATFLGFFPCQGFFSCCFSWSVNDRARARRVPAGPTAVNPPSDTGYWASAAAPWLVPQHSRS